MKTYTNADYARCKAIANEIYNQLFWSIDRDVFWSWGVSKMCYGFYKDMPTRMIRVSGLVHKGWVYISLNEGKDLYEVRLLNVRRVEKKVVTDVYGEDLGAIIDGLVECPTSMTAKEYEKKAMKDSERKLRAA